MNKNVLLIDHDSNTDWSFYKGLNSKELKFQLDKCISNGTQRTVFNKIKKYLKFFLFPFKYFLRRNKYDVIVAWQQFYGIVLCWLLSIFHCKSKVKVYVLTLIYKEKNGFIGKLYKNFMYKSLHCKQLESISVLSSDEVSYYCNIFNLKKEKFNVAHIGIDKEPKFEINKGKYWLSVGRTNRDYDYLIQNFKNIPDENLIILTDTYKVNTIPKNVKIISDCFNDDYEKMLANSYAVIISLSDDPISSGQLTVNNAFIYKKPVIVTNNPGIIEYVENGINSIVIEKKGNQLLEAIKRLKDETIYNNMQSSIKRYSEYDYGVSIAELIERKNNES